MLELGKEERGAIILMEELMEELEELPELPEPIVPASLLCVVVNALRELTACDRARRDCVDSIANAAIDVAAPFVPAPLTNACAPLAPAPFAATKAPFDKLPLIVVNPEDAFSAVTSAK